MSYKYRFIKPIKDPEVLKHLYSYNMSQIGAADHKNLFREYIHVYKDWLSNSGDIKIIGLEKFPYIYFTNGVCGAIDAVVFNTKYKFFSSASDDFPYYKFAVKAGQRQWKNISTSEKQILLFISNPQYSSGIFEKNLIQSQEFNKDIFYDMSYIGCCLWKGEYVIPAVCRFCAFSLSKAFGLEKYRLGILFSKEKLSSLEMLHKLNYLNFNSISISIHMMKHFNISYIPDKYREKYKDICQINKLTETHCPWIALSNGQRTGVSHLYHTNISTPGGVKSSVK